MSAEETLKYLIERKSGSLRAFAIENDMPYTTIRSILERGVLNSKMDNILKICSGLGITPESLIDDTYAANSQADFNILETDNTYNYFDIGLSAGILSEVDPFSDDDIEKIKISNVVMGKYAGDKDVFVTNINGQSMNRVIPDKSLIAVKEYDNIQSLHDGDIVVFQDGSEMSVKRFFNDENNKVIVFNPDSTESFPPIVYQYENLDHLKIIGKVVVYTVEI